MKNMMSLMGKFDLFKITSFVNLKTIKVHVKMMHRQCIAWDKIFENHVYIRVLISIMCKEFSKLKC